MPDINWNVVRPSLWSFGAGLVVGALALSYVFGFMSPLTAERMARTESEKNVVAALAPGCAADFRALPDAKDRLATLAANKDSYTARQAFPEELITVPGNTYVDYDLMKACSALLLAAPKSAALH